MKKGVAPSTTKSIAYSKLASSEKHFTQTGSPIAYFKLASSLSRIDQLIEATTGHELLSFMDAYSGYNQIKMHPPNEVKTAFTTCRDIYCCKVIPFGLKNAGLPFSE